MTRTLFDPPASPDVDDAGPAGEHIGQHQSIRAGGDGNGLVAGGIAVAAECPAEFARGGGGLGDPSTSDGAAAELGKCRALLALGARHAWEVRTFQRAFVEVLLSLADGEAASADAARARVPVSDPCPKWIGAAVNGLVVAGIIERAGDEPGQRRVAHARRVTLWRLKDRAAAWAWIDRNGQAGSGVGA